MSEKGILFDSTRCIGCRACQVACKQWNELSAVATSNRGTYENPPDLSPNTWLTIQFREKFENNRINWYFSRRSCMHCTEAACVDVCPSGALYHNEYGFVSFDKEKCIGCGYCSQFCPFHVPRLDENLVTGAGRTSKCTSCMTSGLGRLSNGQQPACVGTCPSEALKFGDLEELMESGRKRISILQSSASGAHPDAMLYGEKEMGGLHVLYVLADSPEKYGLPVHPEYPVLATIKKDVFNPYTWILWGAVGAGLALNVLVARARQIRSGKEE